MLPYDALEKPLLVVPPCELIQRFEAIIQPTFKKMELNEKESETLAEIRDTLLPKLISGQVRVEDVARFIDG